MTTWSKLEDLRARNALVVRLTLGVVGLALLAMLGALVNVETGSGAQLDDVHVPADWLQGLRPLLLPFGEPYDVGTGMRKVAQWLVLIAFAAGELSAIGFLIWSLIKKRRRLVLLAWFLFVIVVMYTPVPRVLVPGTAQAVSVETAERMLTLKPNAENLFRLAPRFEDNAKTYVRAQIAYAKGDFDLARKLSARVDVASLASPIEAPYRLQFLQGRYQGLTTVCFIRYGCLLEHVRQARLKVFAFLAGALALCGFVLATLGLFLSQRLTRIDALSACADATRAGRMV